MCRRGYGDKEVQRRWGEIVTIDTWGDEGEKKINYPNFRLLALIVTLLRGMDVINRKKLNFVGLQKKK